MREHKVIQVGTPKAWEEALDRLSADGWELHASGPDNSGWTWWATLSRVIA